MKHSKKARKGALHAVEKKLVALLRIISLVVLIIESLIGGADFVRFKFEQAFLAPHMTSSELANSEKSHKHRDRRRIGKNRHRGIDSRGAL
jgi:hypothetical protein